MKGDHAFHVGSKVLDLKCCWNAGLFSLRFDMQNYFEVDWGSHKS